MQVVQTAGVPPSRGKSIFAIISCTQNNKSALRNIVAPNSSTIRRAADNTFFDDEGTVVENPMWNSFQLSVSLRSFATLRLWHHIHRRDAEETQRYAEKITGPRNGRSLST